MPTGRILPSPAPCGACLREGGAHAACFGTWICPGVGNIPWKMLEEGGFNGLSVLTYTAVRSEVLLGEKWVPRAPINVHSHAFL